MKLFETKDGKIVKVYVQMQDIMHVNDTEIPIPATIYMKVLQTPRVTDENRFDFVEFDQEKEIEFFKNLDFIIDFDEYNKLSAEELEKKFQESVEAYNAKVAEWNNLKPEERRRQYHLMQEIENLEYINAFTLEVVYIRIGRTTRKLPKFVVVNKIKLDPEKQ